MHTHNLQRWEHSHKFNEDNRRGERNTVRVIALTGTIMLLEIIAGLATNSMALLADGWHMSTHLAALAITVYAYRLARKHADDRRYAFGTGKVGSLGGFASSIFLGVVALLMAGESVHRFVSPLEINFDWAIRVAVIGLVVNLVSALLLHDRHHSHDHNLRGAYLHVLADAFTSLTAIFALSAGKFFGLTWMDPLMGIVGAAVICVWAYGLMRESGKVLLDHQAQPEILERIKKNIEADSDNRISDLHVWKVSSSHYAVIISIVTHFPVELEHYKSLIKDIPGLEHVTIEINKCREEPCIQKNNSSPE